MITHRYTSIAAAQQKYMEHRSLDATGPEDIVACASNIAFAPPQ
jgi:hypothetical protein